MGIGIHQPAIDKQLPHTAQRRLQISRQRLARDHLSLAQAVGATPDAVQTALAELSAEYTEQGRGFELRNVAGGWRYYTREEYAGVVERFVLDGQRARLTQAALETLAVPLADLRPALEAVLMVADQPLDQVSLARSEGYNPRELARIRRLVEANRAELRERWRDFFSN